jgi:hypothetical protein
VSQLNQYRYVAFDSCQPAFKPGDVLMISHLNASYNTDRFRIIDDPKWRLVDSDELSFIDTRSGTNFLGIGLIVSGPWTLRENDDEVQYVSKYDILVPYFGLVFLYVYHKVINHRTLNGWVVEPITQSMPGLQKL